MNDGLSRLAFLTVECLHHVAPSADPRADIAAATNLAEQILAECAKRLTETPDVKNPEVT